MQIMSVRKIAVVSNKVYVTITVIWHGHFVFARALVALRRFVVIVPCVILPGIPDETERCRIDALFGRMLSHRLDMALADGCRTVSVGGENIDKSIRTVGEMLAVLP